MTSGSGGPVSRTEALRTWVYIGLNSFGGPTGQIAVMHRVLVEQKRWVSDERFLHALNYCMLLPGPEAMQLATYIGWLMHRTLGGVVAGVLFVLPGFLSILALSVIVTAYRGVGLVDGVFVGLKAAVVAIVAEAVLRIGRKVLRNAVMVAIAAGAFIAIFVLNVPFPAIIAAAGLLGFAGARVRPELFDVLAHKPAAAGAHADGPYLTDAMTHTAPGRFHAVRTLTIWGGLWLVPVAVLRLWLGADHVFAALAVFFGKAAVVTFGGAYAVLAYMAQQAVEVYGWLEPGEMLVGLSMAETTPGPLIQVVQYVGYMAAYRDPGPLHPVVAGVLASALTTWVTFVPCFLWVFLGAPYMEQLRGRRSLNAALSAITAAVVGVVLNLAVWFAAHALFDRVESAEFRAGPVSARLLIPDPASLDVASLMIAALAAVLVFGMRWGPLRTLAVCAGLGVGWWAVGRILEG